MDGWGKRDALSTWITGKIDFDAGLFRVMLEWRVVVGVFLESVNGQKIIKFIYLIDNKSIINSI